MKKNNISGTNLCIAAIATTLMLSMLLASCVLDFAPRDRTDFCDSEKWGKVVKEKLDLDKFVSIDVSAAVDLVITQGDKMKVEVEGNEKAISAYSFTVEEETDAETGETYGKLVCEFVKRHDFKTPIVRLHITMPKLLSIEANGSYDVNIVDSVEFTDYPQLTFSINGSGDVSADNLKCNDLLIQIDGSGDIRFRKLECKDLNANIEGSGDINIREASTANVDFNIEGSGDIDGTINADGNITTCCNGSGDIELEVECDTVSIKSEGSGDIEIEGTANVLKKYKSALGSTTTKKLHADSMIWGKD